MKIQEVNEVLLRGEIDLPGLLPNKQLIVINNQSFQLNNITGVTLEDFLLND